MTDPFVIAVGGENLIDQVTTEGVVASHPGGSPFNVAVAAGRQGAIVHYVSPISTDGWGDMLAARLDEAGVTLTGGRRYLPTTMAGVTITKGIPEYLFERDGTAERDVSLASLSQAIAPEVSILHTGSLTLTDGPDAAVWEDVLAARYDAGGLVSIDPNVRLSVISDFETYAARIRRVIAKAHVLKLSDEDLEGLYPDLDQDAAMADVLAQTPAALVVLTRGSQGASAWVQGVRIDVPPRPANPLVDTVGAGDTFMATLLVRLGLLGYLDAGRLAQLTPATAQAILTHAALAAAINCERDGCNPPTEADLKAALETS